MDLAGTFLALRHAKEFAELILSRKLDAAVTEKAIELQGAIISLQSTLMELQSEQQTLRDALRERDRELERLRAWEGELALHELFEPSKGTFVWRAKAASGGTPSPWYCTGCFEGQRKSILQWETQDYGAAYYYCPTCQTKVCDRSDPASP